MNIAILQHMSQEGPGSIADWAHERGHVIQTHHLYDGEALPTADDFDMHEVHIDVHNRYRMGQEYETLPDEVKAEFDKHVQMHEMLLQQKMMEQLMMGGGMPPVGDEEQGGAVDGPGMTPDTGGPGIVGPAPAQPASV